MTCRQFSELTGYKISYVAILCKQGKIATKGKLEGSNRWDILPSEVPFGKLKNTLTTAHTEPFKTMWANICENSTNITSSTELTIPTVFPLAWD